MSTEPDMAMPDSEPISKPKKAKKTWPILAGVGLLALGGLVGGVIGSSAATAAAESKPVPTVTYTPEPVVEEVQIAVTPSVCEEAFGEADEVIVGYAEMWGEWRKITMASLEGGYNTVGEMVDDITVKNEETLAIAEEYVSLRGQCLEGDL
jgi:hypothetical protein